MKKLFIHHGLFRLLSPLFSGTLVYLLILLINNNIGQVQESFLGQELYVCIGLAYVIQEYARLSLLAFDRLGKSVSFLTHLLLQVVTSIGVCVLLVSLSMYFYFNYVLGYTPNFRELLIFNSLFALITLIYVILYRSHQFLYMINTERINREVEAKKGIEADFAMFKKGINPRLLFESLEAILVIMKSAPEEAESLSDHFSAVYRYLLSKRVNELVPVSEEIDILQDHIKLFNHLPYRKVELQLDDLKDSWTVPGSFLMLSEKIIRSTIPSENKRLKLSIDDKEDRIEFHYETEEVLNGGLDKSSLKDINKSYSFYSDRDIQLSEGVSYKTIKLPKLKLNESSHT